MLTYNQVLQLARILQDINDRGVYHKNLDTEVAHLDNLLESEWKDGTVPTPMFAPFILRFKNQRLEFLVKREELNEEYSPNKTRLKFLEGSETIEELDTSTFQWRHR